MVEANYCSVLVIPVIHIFNRLFHFLVYLFKDKHIQLHTFLHNILIILSRQSLKNRIPHLEMFRNSQKHHMHKGKNLQINFIPGDAIKTMQSLQQVGPRLQHQLMDEIEV